MSKNEELEKTWFTAGVAFGWLWERAFTRPGQYIFIAIWAAATLLFGYGAGDSFRSYAAVAIIFPVVCVLVAVFLLIGTLLGDAFADWVADHVFSDRLRSTSLIHQLIYFLLSCAGLILALFILSMGDYTSGPNIP